MSIETLQQETGVEILWRYFPLHPEIPEQGVSLAEYFKIDDDRAQTIHRGIREKITAQGLDYSAQPGTLYNTRMAQELAKWIDLHHPEFDARKIFYNGFLVENINLGQKEILLDYIARQGLPRAEAEQVLKDNQMAEAINLDWGRSRSVGVTSIPSFLAHKVLLVGAQGIEKMREFYQYALNNPPS